jgi:hypothetical protein
MGLKHRSLEVHATDQHTIDGDASGDGRKGALERLGQLDVLADLAPDRKQESGVSFHGIACRCIIGRIFCDM